ncbi:2-C-methyl-D-erythritol 4-phosphate cytidylyltransferase, partial [Parasphingorhabdus sp.]
MVETRYPCKKTDVLIVAAGIGSRAGLDIPKQFEPVGGKSMIRHSVERFQSHDAIDRIWIVVAEGQEDEANKALSPLSAYKLVIGGATRQQSVSNGLQAIESHGGTTNILVHDAARPFISHMVINRLLTR